MGLEEGELKLIISLGLLLLSSCGIKGDVNPIEIVSDITSMAKGEYCWRCPDCRCGGC